MSNNQFYGWYDDPTQPIDQPTHNPPHPGPCLLCGALTSDDDVRTVSMMMAGKVYAKRSYFYRLHRTCAIANPQAESDDIIWDMIQRNGD